LPDEERSKGDPAGRGVAAVAGVPVPFMLGIEGGLGGALSEPGPRLNTNGYSLMAGRRPLLIDIMRGC
jgi:hypothetical protein